MATHDYVIANNTGANVRSDINGALAAIVSNNSSSSEPATTYAYQWWADTNANVLKIRNSANNGWITLRELDGTMLIEDGSASTPGLAFADDVNTGIFSGAADQIGFATGGAERLEIGSSEVVFNDPSNDVDFRVESDGNTHMLFVDAGNDRVGIGASSPNGSLSVQAESGRLLTFRNSTTGTGASDGSYITLNGSDLQIANAESANTIFYTSDTERARIETSGRLLVGTSSAITTDGGCLFQLASSSAGNICLGRNDTTTAAGENLGAIRWYGNDSNGTYEMGASIEAVADLDHGTGDKPSRLVFSTTADGASSPTERLRITNDGTIQLRNSPGIDFSQIQTNVAGMTSETLDSYEEGTFTPEFAGSTTAGTYTYATRTGHYTKIGEMVNVTVKLTNITTSSAGSGNVNITGLPFTSANNVSFACGSVVLDQFDTATGTISVAVRNDPNTAVLEIRESRDNDTDSALDVADKSSNAADIFCTITYRV